MDLDRFYHMLRRELPDLELRLREPMSCHTTFRVGGPAALMALPSDPDQLSAAVRLALREGIRPLYVGNGSNLLVDDGGLDAFVIKTVPQMSRCTVDGQRIFAEAGTLLVRLANTAADHADISLMTLCFQHATHVYSSIHSS